MLVCVFKQKVFDIGLADKQRPNMINEKIKQKKSIAFYLKYQFNVQKSLIHWKNRSNRSKIATKSEKIAFRARHFNKKSACAPFPSSG